MKHLKKAVAVLLTLCMAFVMTTLVFADVELGGAQYSDDASVTITKVYRLEGSGVSPAETFTLQQIGKGVVKDGEAAEAPDLGTITGASFAKGAATVGGTEAGIVVDLPVYERVGVYEYTLRETAGTTAGVTYYGNDIRLVVTVINDPDTGKLRIAAVHTESAGAEKSDSFPNTYSAGTLHITKTVTGNLGDKTRYFKFTVTLTGEQGKVYGESYAVTGGSYAENPAAVKIGESAVFYLKDGETLSLENLPYGVSYTVEEDTPEDYTVTKSGETGTVGSASATAAFTNNKGGTPDTGIRLNSLPYIAMLALASSGLLVTLLRKRAAKNR